VRVYGRVSAWAAVSNRIVSCALALLNSAVSVHSSPMKIFVPTGMTSFQMSGNVISSSNILFQIRQYLTLSHEYEVSLTTFEAEPLTVLHEATRRAWPKLVGASTQQQHDREFLRVLDLVVVKNLLWYRVGRPILGTTALFRRQDPLESGSAGTIVRPT
jgi:hypothetical protein